MIIETSYTIGDYVDKFEAYKEQLRSANVLQTISSMMIPEFKEFIAKKFEKLQESKEEDKPKPKKE